MLESDDDLPEPEPPAPDRVARRAFVLAAVACRSAIEDNASDPAAEQFRHDVYQWLATNDILHEAEPMEETLLRAPLGSLTERQIVDAGWRAEGLGVLAWALGRYELPSYQRTVDGPEVGDLLGFLMPEGADLISNPTLREQDELELLAERLLALHWRLRQFTIQAEHMDFATFAREAYFGPLDIEGLDLVDGDLAIDGHPLLDVPEDRLYQCLSIVRERQQAANWLSGQEPIYSDITCDT